MRIETMIILLVLMFMAYIFATYKKLIGHYHKLVTLEVQIEIQNNENKNTDINRRKYNAIVRDYNNTLSSVIGKVIAKKLAYRVKPLIDKT